MTEYERDQVVEMVISFKEEISLLKESNSNLTAIVNMQNDIINKYKHELDTVKAVIHGMNDALNNKESD